VATEPSRTTLVPDEFHVLAAREAQRHHKAPGAPRPTPGPRSLGWLSAAEPLLGVAGCGGSTSTSAARVAARVSVLAAHRRVDRDVLNALFGPRGDQRAAGLQRTQWCAHDARGPRPRASHHRTALSRSAANRARGPRPKPAAFSRHITFARSSLRHASRNDILRTVAAAVKEQAAAGEGRHPKTSSTCCSLRFTGKQTKCLGGPGEQHSGLQDTMSRYESFRGGADLG
jgi:hypothetical protein